MFVQISKKLLEKLWKNDCYKVYIKRIWLKIVVILIIKHVQDACLTTVKVIVIMHKPIM